MEGGDEEGETHGNEGELLPGGEYLRYDDPNHIAIEEALEEQYPAPAINPNESDDEYWARYERERTPMHPLYDFTGQDD